jgi:hypothetical protein
MYPRALAAKPAACPDQTAAEPDQGPEMAVAAARPVTRLPRLIGKRATTGVRKFVCSWVRIKTNFAKPRKISFLAEFDIFFRPK